MGNKLKGAELRAAQEAEKVKREAAKGGGNGKGTIEAAKIETVPETKPEGAIEKTVGTIKGFLNQPDQPQEQPAQTLPVPTLEPIPAPQGIDVEYVKNLGNMLIELKKERDTDRQTIEGLRQQVAQLATGNVDLSPIIKEIQTAFTNEKAKIEDAIKAIQTEMGTRLTAIETELIFSSKKIIDAHSGDIKKISEKIPLLEAKFADVAKGSRVEKVATELARIEQVLNTWKNVAENFDRILKVKIAETAFAPQQSQVTQQLTQMQTQTPVVQQTIQQPVQTPSDLPNWAKL